jgi:hypothetical protein
MNEGAKFVVMSRWEDDPHSLTGLSASQRFLEATREHPNFIGLCLTTLSITSIEVVLLSKIIRNERVSELGIHNKVGLGFRQLERHGRPDDYFRRWNTYGHGRKPLLPVFFPGEEQLSIGFLCSRRTNNKGREQEDEENDPSYTCSNFIMDIVNEKNLRPEQAERRLKKFLFNEAPLHQVSAEILYPLMELQKSLKGTLGEKNDVSSSHPTATTISLSDRRK